MVVMGSENHVQAGTHQTFIVATRRSKLAIQSLSDDLNVEYVRTKIPLFLQLRRIFHDRMPEVAICNTCRETRAAIIACGLSWKSAIIFRRGLCKGIGRGQLRKWFYSRVDHFICNSQATADAVKQSQSWLTDSDLAVVVRASGSLCISEEDSYDHFLR